MLLTLRQVMQSTLRRSHVPERDGLIGRMLQDQREPISAAALRQLKALLADIGTSPLSGAGPRLAHRLPSNSSVAFPAPRTSGPTAVELLGTVVLAGLAHQAGWENVAVPNMIDCLARCRSRIGDRCHLDVRKDPCQP